MNTIFIDTSAFIALRVSNDINHRPAQEFLKIIKKEKIILHTSNFILDEVYTFFCKFHDIAIEMVNLIRSNPIILLHRITAQDEDMAWKILNKYSDKDFSYTDATSFSVMERLKINKAFAFDDQFYQYKNIIRVP